MQQSPTFGFSFVLHEAHSKKKTHALVGITSLERWPHVGHVIVDLRNGARTVPRLSSLCPFRLLNPRFFCDAKIYCSLGSGSTPLSIASFKIAIWSFSRYWRPMSWNRESSCSRLILLVSGSL